MTTMAFRITRAIARIADSDRYSAQTHKSQILPLLRLLTALLCIFLCALSRNAVFVTGVIAAGFLRLGFMPAERILHVLRNLLPPVLFSILIMLPAVFLGHPGTMLTVAMKVLESVLVLALLGEELSWKDITGAFQSLHFPQIFLLTLDMTIRFLIILGKYCGELSEAVQLRSFPAASAQRRNQDLRRMYAAGGVLGTAFLKSGRLSEETYEAMECRCFDGTYRTYSRHRLSLQDLLFGLLIPFLILSFWYTQRAMGL